MARHYGAALTPSCPDLPGLVRGIRASTACSMRAFDEICLTPVEDMPPEKTRAVRLHENASQAVFARHLNVTTSLVSQ